MPIESCQKMEQNVKTVAREAVRMTVYALLPKDFVCENLKIFFSFVKLFAAANVI